LIARLVIAASTLALAACNPPLAFQTNGMPPPANCRAGAGVNRHVALTFYRRALIDKDVRGAFEVFMAPGFIEHKPDVAGGSREATIVFLEGLMKQLPAARWEVVRSVADGEMVAIHARFQPAPGAPEYVIADFFRLENCRIVEHWDVVAGPSEAKGNPNPRI
jgi:predicted SnoaL-like aldol condensation-catalyzing enzyme